ncbi:MAG: V-type ATP synthase subunit I [Clostridia bacterium]|nr:V-type ATP synthase subunit I [Clostridia bacterium]
MSIAKMNKVTIIGTKDKQEKIIKDIMKKGFIQVDNNSNLAYDEEYKDIFNKVDNNQEIALLNNKKVQVEKAINIINRVNKLKKPFFYSKPNYVELTENEADSLYKEAEQIINFQNEISKLEWDCVDFENRKQELIPWKSLDISADLMSLKHIKIILGKVSINYQLEQIELALSREVNKYSINLVNKDKQFTYIVIITNEENENLARRVLKAYDFSEENVIDKEKTIVQKINDIDIEIRKIENKIENLTKKIIPDKLSKFENLYDYLSNQKELKIVENNIVTTKNTFYLEGWIPAGIKIKNDKTYIIKYREPEENENYPVYVKNSKFVTPFQSITNMYSVPNRNELDPNPIMTIFFIIFFGMMLSDAGYGIILTLFAAFIVKKAKYKKGEGSLMKLLIPCGISTIFWGLLFGSFFGDLIKITPIINPLIDVMQLMGLSLLLGIIHMYIGMFMKAIELVKEKKIFSAIFDVGLWYITLTGTFLLVIPIIAGDIGVWSVIGKYLAIVGMIGLVLTQGRTKKGIFGKLIGGIGGLYNITSYFADVLSYSRLMALCLSTGVIAQVGNLLAKMVNPVFGVLIALIVHAINIANSALGSYVHTSRLQYVEFFGKFYEGGGTEFQPLKCKNKYTNIEEEF